MIRPRPSSATADARRRALAFVSAVEDACAQAVRPCPGGHLLLDWRHPGLWSANHLRVEATHPPDAPALDAVAAHHLDRLGFRMITVLRGAAASQLRDPLARLDYRSYDQLLMVLGEPAAGPAAAPAIVEVDARQRAASRIAAAVEAGLGVEVGRQLASRDALVGGVVAQRCLAILAGDDIAARCQVYSRAGVAQVENVYTAPPHRRRGLARALVSTAARQARAAGCQLVFLVADAADWPQTFYQRLGFVDAGRITRFRRDAAPRLGRPEPMPPRSARFDAIPAPHGPPADHTKDDR